MQLTNTLGLPDAVVRAVKNDNYNRGESDITVTELISPAQQVALKHKHKDDIVEDVSDRIYSLMGQAMHIVLERANVTAIAEKRLYGTVAGWRVGGQFDSLAVHYPTDSLQQKAVLIDFKQMSVWEKIYGLRAERTEQLNLLAWLVEENYPNLKLERIEVISIFRDWSKREAMRRRQSGDTAYPQHQVAVIPIEMWPQEQQQKFIEDRVHLHQEAQSLAKMPSCSEEDRWMKPTTFALMKKGRKSALRVTNSIEELYDYARNKSLLDDASELKTGHEIVERPGENIRCADYCSVSDFCPQWAAIQKNENTTEH
tara:strand:- start:304 stop:1242 length:939 start_codon:yes stop_codon:yes gene_type:complete